MSTTSKRIAAALHDEMVRRGKLSYAARIARHGKKAVTRMLSKAGRAKKHGRRLSTGRAGRNQPAC